MKVFFLANKTVQVFPLCKYCAESFVWMWGWVKGGPLVNSSGHHVGRDSLLPALLHPLFMKNYSTRAEQNTTEREVWITGVYILKSRCQQDWFFLKSSLLGLACRWPSFFWVSSQGLPSVCVWDLISSYKDSSHIGRAPTHKISCHLNYFFKDLCIFPLSDEVLGIVTSTYKFI